MDFDLSPAQRAFRDEVRAFVHDRLPDDIRQRLRVRATRRASRTP
jgi:pimeloyl-CoA dehydrogenase